METETVTIELYNIKGNNKKLKKRSTKKRAKLGRRCESCDNLVDNCSDDGMNSPESGVSSLDTGNSNMEFVDVLEKGK